MSEEVFYADIELTDENFYLRFWTRDEDGIEKGYDWLIEDLLWQKIERQQLRAELEMNKANLESFMQLQGEHKKLCDLVAERYKIYLKDQAEMVRLRAALDEARKVILHTFQEHDGCNFAEDWLMAHPEEK